jgi:hypothetical protein
MFGLPGHQLFFKETFPAALAAVRAGCRQAANSTARLLPGGCPSPARAGLAVSGGQGLVLLT